MHRRGRDCSRRFLYAGRILCAHFTTPMVLRASAGAPIASLFAWRLRRRNRI